MGGSNDDAWGLGTSGCPPRGLNGEHSDVRILDFCFIYCVGAPVSRLKRFAPLSDVM